MKTNYIIKSTFCILFSLLNILAYCQKELNSQLIEAVKKSNIEEVKKLVEQGADVNATDSRKATVLMWAAYKSNLEMVKYLVSKGADYTKKGTIKIKHGYYGNLTGIAAAEGKLDILKYLIEYCKIDIDDREYNSEDDSETGWSALEWANKKGKNDIIEYILSKNEITKREYKPELRLPIGHTAQITSICFSPDGKYVLSGSLDKTVKLWEISSGKLIRTFEGHTKEIISVCFSPDGKYGLSSSKDNSMKLWEISNGRLIKSFQWDDEIISIKFSHDGNFILSGTSYGVSLWNISSGKLIEFFEKPRGVIGRIIAVEWGNAFDFSSDGKYALSSLNEKIILWEISGGKLIKKFDDYNGHISSLCFSPDGKFALSVDGEKQLIKLWEIPSGKLIKTYEHTGQSASFSPDSRYAISGSYGFGELTLFEISTGKKIKSFSGGTSCFSPDGKFVLSSSKDYKLKLWDVSIGSIVKSMGGHTCQIGKVNFTPDGKYILANSCGVKLWDLESGKLINSFGGNGCIEDMLCVSPDGKNALKANCSEELKLYEIPGGKLIKKFNDSIITSANFSADNKYVISGSRNSIKLWDLANGSLLKTFKENTGIENSLSFTPDSKYILSASGRNSYLSNNHVLLFYLFKFHRYNSDVRMNLREISSGKLIRTFGNNKADYKICCFSPDGKYAVSTGKKLQTLYKFKIIFDKDIMMLWDVNTGKLIRSFKENIYDIKSVCFSTDGRYLLSGSGDGAIKLWDVSTGAFIKTFKGNNKASIKSVSFSPDGKRILSSNSDNIMKLWDINSGKEIATLINIDSTDWAVTTPSGLFDASEGAMKLMYYVAGTEPIELEQMKDRYWRPGLLQSLLGYSDFKPIEGKEFGEVKLYPEIKLTINKKSENEDLLSIHLKNKGGGFGKVSVYIKDKEIIEDARRIENGEWKIENEELDSLILIPNINLKNLKDISDGTDCRISVRAYNSINHIQSLPQTIIYNNRKIAKDELLQLFVVSVGVSKFSGPGIRKLKFAAKDGEDIANALEIGSKKLFTKAFIYRLTSKQTDTLNEPTKANIERIFDTIGKKARVKDVIVVYLAGHGTSLGGEAKDFYFYTKDAYTTNIEDAALRKFITISGKEIKELMRNIVADKKVLIIDACHSGKMTNDLTETRDIQGSTKKALDELSSKTGFHILTGCAADQKSWEATEYGQGILTYSLLQGIKGSGLKQGKFVDVNTLFQWAKYAVPLLKTKNGGIQTPDIINEHETFNIGLLETEDKAKIILAKAKPMILMCSLKDRKRFDDNLNIESIVDDNLRDITAGDNPPLIFIETNNYTDAYKINGFYSIDGDNVDVDINIMKDTDIIKSFSLKGNKTKKEKLAEDIVKMAQDVCK